MTSDAPRPATLAPAPAFGRFASIGDFLTAYRADLRRETAAALAPLSLERQAAFLAQPRDIAEVRATVLSREPDDTDAEGGLHDRFTATILSADSASPGILADVQDCIASGRAVFVAVRTGDSEGIQVPVAGLVNGAALHLKGEWITREQAESHGGEQLSVLHFTHHPLGFICTPVDCYS